MLDDFDDLAVHQTEVAAIQRNIQVTDAAQQAIKAEIAEALEQALFPLRADGVDDLVAVPPTLDKLSEDFRRVLQIAIHDDDRATARQVDARTDRRLVTEVPTQVDTRDA